MAFQFRPVAVLVLFASATSSQVNPVEKVINLLSGMKSEIEKEGKAEAATYEKFACFCKDATSKKSKSITTGQDTIDKLSASIAEKSATKAGDETSVQGLKSKKESLSKELQDSVALCAKQKAVYENDSADLNKALFSLKKAIKSLSDKKAAMDKVLVQVDGGFQADAGLQETLELADAMGLITKPNQKAFLQRFSSLLQDAGAAVPEYSYHSSDIVDLLVSLQKDFSKNKATKDSEYGKTAASCKALATSLSSKIETNSKETKSTSEKVNKGKSEIADNRGKLVEAQDMLKNDERYLKDLTSRCEERAVQWDQRSTLRGGEITAISTALKVLGDRVKSADSQVNKRALLLVTPVKAGVAKATPVKAATTKAAPVKVSPKAIPVKTAAAVKAAPSFLQRVITHAHDLSISSQEAREQLAKEQAVTAIKNEGLRLGSPILTALAMQVAIDPFKKVKQLIQGLVERLLTEAASEATKKGFCDTEIGKATKDRDFRWTRVKKLTAGISLLQANEDSLKEELDSLTKLMPVLEKALVDTTKSRKEEKAENAKTIETARDGLEAVNEALLLLRTFYKESAAAAMFLQVQASPIDEDSPGAGFSSGYQGKQQSSNAVLALLETIVSDFQRTIASTEANEDENARSFVKFTRATKTDIGSKKTKMELNAQDLKTTSTQLKVSRADMQTNMDLVDDAVKTLMELKPTCIDTGMSFKERVAKREEEVGALKKALCLLDTEKVEAACK